MLRITRQTDYGVILLTHLAAHPGRVYNAPELASDAGIPLPMTGKVLKTLTRAGILHSHRGATGGYSLARAPEAISVAQILTALEGPIALTECIASGPGECGQEVGCPTRGNWERINLALQLALQDVSLADMTRPTPIQNRFPRTIPLELRLPVLSTVGSEEP